MRKLSSFVVLLPLLLLSLLMGCAGGGSVTARYSGDSWGRNDQPWTEGRRVGGTAFTGEAVVLKSEPSSSPDFEVTIEHVEAPPVMGRNDTLHLAFVISVKNRTAEPVTIKRLTLQNAGSNFEVDTVSKKMDVAIEPQATSKFELVARATGIDANVGANVPMTVRATIDSVQNESRHSASFVRSLNGHVAVSVSK